MELMELTALRNAHVGSPGISGLSVEQRKRLTIGVELVANPSIIFMDVSLRATEPRRPLDSCPEKQERDILVMDLECNLFYRKSDDRDLVCTASVLEVF